MIKNTFLIGRKILPISIVVHPVAIYCIVTQKNKCICNLGEEIKLMPT